MIRTTLLFSVVFFALVGAVLISYPFIKSLSPNEKQVNELPRTDISNLKNGSFIEAQGPWYRAFILKGEAGGLRIFSVPYYGDKYRMPDPTWNRPNGSCDKFGPESEGNRLVSEGRFRCFDENASRWVMDLEWDFEGSSLVTPYEDMQIPKYEIRGQSVFFS